LRQRVFLKSPVRDNRTPEPVLSLSKESVRGLLGDWQSYRDARLILAEMT
jgi:hypothetical protein